MFNTKYTFWTRREIFMKLLRLLLPLACLTLFACGVPETSTSSSSISSSSVSTSSSVSSSSVVSSSSSSVSVGSAICPENDTCVILPLGDSITDGIGSGTRGGGYRVELFRLATEDGYDITYVGNHTPNGPSTVAGKSFPRAHEGHSGWTISQIDGIVPGNSALDGNPHIILLHIGTNDGWSNPSGAEGRLENLIDKILRNNPTSLLAVASIIPWPGQDSFVNSYNQQIPGIVQKFADQGMNIIFVDQNSGFPPSELSDGVHPNNAGYDRMGRTWYAAIEEYLN